MTTPSELLSIYSTQSQMNSFFTDKIGIIYPEQFGAVGDGATDDTEALQDCIDYAITNKLLISSKSSNSYKVTDALNITGEVSIDMQGATIRAYHSGNIININYATNTYAGFIRNIELDCNSTANSGIYVTIGRRYHISNVKFVNLLSYGLYIDDGNVMKFSYLFFENSNTNTAVAIYNDASDMVFDHIDGINIRTFIHHAGGNCFYEECHAFIREANYDDSIFFKMSSVAKVVLTNCYPDTQQYAYYISEYVDLKIIGNYYYSNPIAATLAQITAHGVPYIFYFTNTSYKNRVTVRNSQFNGNTITVGGQYVVKLSNFAGVDIGSTSFENLDSTTINTYTDTGDGYPINVYIQDSVAFVDAEFTYNPSSKGKLSKSTGLYLGTIAIHSTCLPPKNMHFKVPVNYNGYITDVIGKIEDGGNLRIFASVGDFDNDLYLCNASDNIDYAVKLTVCFPLLNRTRNNGTWI